MIVQTGLFPYFWACSALGFLYAVVKLLRFGRREKHLPPGPPTWPIIGNAHLTVDPKLFKKFQQWSAQYGDVFSLKVGKGTIVVLNSKRSVYELVDQRSALYNSRPLDKRFRLAMRENFAFMDPTPIWRVQRKIAVRYIAPEKLDGHLDKVSNAEITELLHDLLDSPEDFIKHIERSTASFTAIVLFGQRAKTNDDFWARGVYDAMEAIMHAISPGSHLPSEEFPILKLIPRRWDPSYARAEEGYEIPTRIWTEARQRVELRRSQGDKRESLIDELLNTEKELDPRAFEGTMLANYLGTVMQAAAETSALSTKTNIMFLATHPAVQDKAQKEIDAVCGVERLPCFSDFKDMPYINCIVKESQRIRPVVPTGIPHRCTQDNWYNGMLIPKDATIIIPHWALHHSKYEDAGTYNPDRYLNHPQLAWDYAGTKDFENRDHYNYGAGRRICAGIQLAERTQWRQVARILWAFRLEHAVDEKGEKIPIDLDAYEDKLVCGPEPFKVKFTPRSQRHVDLIKKEMGDVREILRAWE